MTMKKNSSRISLLLAVAMVIGLFAAFPAMSASAADTNYALNIVPTIFTDEAGTTAATAASGTASSITDGVYESTEVHYYFGGNNVYYVNFDLGSVKTDLQSVLLYMRTVSNRVYPSNVKISVSSDGSTYTDVSYKMLGLDTTTTANYTYGNYQFESVQSGRYVRLALTAGGYVTSFGEIEIRNYGLADASASVATEDPTLVDGNYAYGASYTVTKDDGDPAYRNAAQTDSGNMLTDGYEAAAPSANGTNNYTVAFAGTNSVYVITLSLTAAKSDVSYVTFVNVPATGSSFADPTNVAISTSNDGLTYTSVGTLTASSEAKNNGGANDLTYSFGAVSAQYVQITVTLPQYLFGLDEIVIGGSGSAPSTDPVISCDPTVITSSTETNYALSSNGAYYAYGNVFPDNTSYLDDTFTASALNKFGQGQLNDGTDATDSYNDTAWVGFVGSATTMSSVEVIFDLAHVYGDIDQIAFTTLAHGGDTESYEKVEQITVAFGDINGNYGAATTVTGLVTENSYTSDTGKAVSRFTSQFAVSGPSTGARYVKITIPKATYRLFVDEIQVIGASGFDYSAEPSSEEPSSEAPASSEAPVSSEAGSSVDESYEAERGGFTPNASYINEPQFRTDLSAEYGEWDTDGDGTNDFTGIAVTISLVDIKYQYGIYGVEGFLNFDNTYLTPLYVNDADLNGTAIYDPPKTILTWPTVEVNMMGSVFTLKCVEGLCQSYSMEDGSTVNPSNADQTFSKTYSRMRYRYIMHTDYFEGYNKDSDHLGISEDNAMQIRYYFTVAEGHEGETFTFTVPDSPEAQHIAYAKLYAPAYDPENVVGLTSVYGMGDEVSVTIPEATKTYTVTFVANGETVDTLVVNEGEGVTAPDAPAVEGYHFVEWDTDFSNVQSDLTVTAVYAINTYTVTFVANGQTIDTQTVNHGSAATAPQAPEVEGSTFKEWDTDFSNVTSDLTVNAVYEENAPEYDFWTFATGADTTGFTVDETNGYLKISTGLKTAAQIKAIFANADITVTTASGSAVADTAIASTTRVITSTINGESKSLTIVTLGDVNGDGRINAADYGRAKAHVNGSTVLTGANFEAANVVAISQGKINAADYGKIKNFVNGIVNKF